MYVRPVGFADANGMISKTVSISKNLIRTPLPPCMFDVQRIILESLTADSRYFVEY
jgi:hypothetical protein